MFFHHTVIRLRAPVVRDRHGNRAPDWPNAARTALHGVFLAPSGQGEAHDPGARDRATTGWQLQTPPGVDVDLLPTDRVELPDGTVCDVVGEVARHFSPFTGAVHHVEVFLQRTTG